MAAERHVICVGDTLTPLGFQCKQRDADGSLSVVSLSGKTVKFSMENEAGTKVIDEVTSGVAVTDATNGKGTFTFSGAQVATAGTYYGYVTVYSGSSRDTYPTGNRKLIIEIVEPA